MKDTPFENDLHCFVCGVKNERGMKLRVEKVGNEAYIKTSLDKTYQGYKDVVHGGILVTLMDEVMAYAASDSENAAVTARINCKFLKPVRVGKTILVTGRVKSKDKDWVTAVAEIRDAETNELLTQSEGIFKLLKK